MFEGERLYLTMPFTFSHPAAILPAKYFPEKWISFTALVIGSITPDFEYFIRMRNFGEYGHTWTGIFWFDLPLAFALTFIYHAFVRDGLIDNLPRILRKRLIRFKGLSWPNYVKGHFWVVLVCLLVGITSHILWDGFTHRTGYFVGLMPWLNENTYIFWGIGYSRFYVLQQISSLAGVILVFYALFRLPPDETVGRKSIIAYWLIAGTLTVLIATIRVYFGLHRLPLEQFHYIFSIDFYLNYFNHRLAEDFIMTVISAFMISLVLTPFIVKEKATNS
jgi:hypothetical protein